VGLSPAAYLSSAAGPPERPPAGRDIHADRLGGGGFAGYWQRDRDLPDFSNAASRPGVLKTPAMQRCALLTLAVLHLISSGAFAAKIVINGDGVLEVGDGGEKTFLIGFIMPPQPQARTPWGNNGIDEIASAGATFIRTGIIGPNSRWDDAALARERAWQDAAARNGMHCLVGVRYAGSVQDDKPENERALRRVIEEFRKHPGMGAYYGIDEPDWGKHPVEPMERAYQIIKENDPDHPLWICQAPRGSVASMKRYDNCGDATGGDIYPISYPPGLHVLPTAKDVPPQLANNSDISLAGDFTRMMMEVADNPHGKKPVWMCLQISWSGVNNPGRTLRFPTFHEQRFMTYQTIIAGARGIIYFGGSNMPALADEDKPYGWNWRYWRRVLRPIVEEIGTKSPLYPALVAAESKLPVKVAPSDGIEYCVRETDDAVFLLACRRDRATTEVKFAGLPVPDQSSELLFESPRKVELKAGMFSDWFAPFEVHVYRFQKRGD
jgi:hypothetical protein